MLINADRSKQIGQTSIHKSLVNRIILPVNIDGSDTLLFLSGSEAAWGVHTLCGSESSFRWSTLETIQEWLRTAPEDFTFKAVPDDLAQEELGPGEVCSVVVGLLGSSVFLGYRGFECFRGGLTTLDDVTRIIETIQSLKP